MHPLQGVESPALEVLKDRKMWHSGTWLSGGLGSIELMTGLYDLKGLFQPQFYDCVWTLPCSPKAKGSQNNFRNKLQNRNSFSATLETSIRMYHSFWPVTRGVADP